jgi:hypothetical protein
VIALPALFQLKQEELKKKSESIGSELAAWQALTEIKRPLEKHYRQVRRLSSELAGMIEVVESEMQALQEASDMPSFLYQLRRSEFLILEIHRTWHYFRQKLAARQGPPFADLLEALDEFVWNCYQPTFVHRNSSPEPPLTFFSSDWSPAASSRQELLALEHTVDFGTGPYGRAGELTRKRLSTLVIPVISMPWFQTTFLPEALLLAHETAHLLEYDLQLTANIEHNLQATPIELNRLKDCWLPWSSEVFADLYAVLHLGPAYVGALSLLLSQAAETVLHMTDPNNHYPPHHLRMLIALSALNHIAGGVFKDDAAQLAKNWHEAYGDPVPDQPGNYEVTNYTLSDCAQDIGYVVSALLDGPFDALGGKAFQSVENIPWTMQEQLAAYLVRDSLLNRGLPLQSAGAHILLAGAQLAFQTNPRALLNSGPSRQQTQADLIQRIVQSRAPGIRAVTLDRLPQLDSQSDAADKTRGRNLAQELLATFEQQHGSSTAP